MTQHIAPLGKAMTAIAMAIAFTSTPSIARDVSAPPEPVADTVAETPTAADPLVAGEAPASIDAAVPSAPKPKVETAKTMVKPTKASASGSTAQSTARRISRAAPAAAPAATALPTLATPAAQAAAPASPPPAPAPLAAPPAAEAAPASSTQGTLGALMPELMADDMMLPAAGAAALGLLALGGAGIAMRRRKRRREEEEFETRQQYLDMAEAEPPILDLDRADEAGPAPAFAQRPAPTRDSGPIGRAPGATAPGRFDMPSDQPAHWGSVGGTTAFPDRGNWESRADSNFLFRRAPKQVKNPVEES